MLLWSKLKIIQTGMVLLWNCFPQHSHIQLLFISTTSQTCLSSPKKRAPQRKRKQRKRKQRKEANLIATIDRENHSLTGNIVSLRVLRTDESSNSVLARISFNSVKLRDNFVATSKLFFENVVHRVSKVKAGREIRRCLSCQKFKYHRFASTNDRTH